MKAFPKFSTKYRGKCKCKQGRAKPHLVTYHGTQGASALSGAMTLTSRVDGSAHEVHDAKEGYKLAADDEILCGVLGANTGNYHIEDATFATWSRKVWFLHKRTLQWSAFRIASALRRNGIPCRFITLKEAQHAGGVDVLRGWTYHCVLSATNWCHSTHTDPARNAGMGPSLFPHRWFARQVQGYYDHPDIKGPVTFDRKGKVKR